MQYETVDKKVKIAGSGGRYIGPGIHSPLSGINLRQSGMVWDEGGGGRGRI